MLFETKKPCASCPYRKDATPGMWDPYEFQNLKRQDRNELGGAMFGCHKFRNKPETASVCAGWFLDQKNRGFPSIQLRLYMITKKLTEEQIDSVTDGGHELYSSIDEMCEAQEDVPVFHVKQRKGSK
jgi:hypothetical protein